MKKSYQTHLIALGISLLVSTINSHSCDSDNRDTPPLKVGVFCSADDKVSQEFKTLSSELGRQLAGLKVELITGGSKTGLMKLVMDGYTEGSSYHTLYGILPTALKVYDIVYPSIPPQNISWTDTIHQRLSFFQNACNVVIVLPGGWGTLHELMDFLVANQFGITTTKVILLNIDHFWDSLINLFESMVKANTLAPKHLQILQVVSTLEECLGKIKEPLPSFMRNGLKDHYWEATTRNGKYSCGD